jgi:hypothetical protein
VLNLSPLKFVPNCKVTEPLWSLLSGSDTDRGRLSTFCEVFLFLREISKFPQNSYLPYRTSRIPEDRWPLFGGTSLFLKVCWFVSEGIPAIVQHFLRKQWCQEKVKPLWEPHQSWGTPLPNSVLQNMCVPERILTGNRFRTFQNCPSLFLVLFPPWDMGGFHNRSHSVGGQLCKLDCVPSFCWVQIPSRNWPFTPLCGTGM